jgi:hypothetical protein
MMVENVAGVLPAGGAWVCVERCVFLPLSRSTQECFA